MLGISRDISPIGPETVMMIGNLRIANSTMLLFLIVFLLAILCWYAVTRFRVRPNSFQAAIEMLYEGIADFLDQITSDRERTNKIFPVIAAIFIFVGISNLIGLVPGLTSITIDGVSLFRTPTADFNTTFGLAFGSVLVLQFVSMYEWGIFGHIGKFVKVKDVYRGFRGGIKSGVMALIEFAIGLLDIIGEFAKIFSLSLRLFGNMYAGEVLMIIIVGGFAVLVPSLWLSMTILSGLIQALVFGSLVAAYYMLSIKPDEDESGQRKG